MNWSLKWFLWVAVATAAGGGGAWAVCVNSTCSSDDWLLPPTTTTTVATTTPREPSPHNFSISVDGQWWLKVNVEPAWRKDSGACWNSVGVAYFSDEKFEFNDFNILRNLTQIKGCLPDAGTLLTEVFVWNREQNKIYDAIFFATTLKTWEIQNKMAATYFGRVFMHHFNFRILGTRSIADDLYRTRHGDYCMDSDGVGIIDRAEQYVGSFGTSFPLGKYMDSITCYSLTLVFHEEAKRSRRTVYSGGLLNFQHIMVERFGSGGRHTAAVIELLEKGYMCTISDVPVYENKCYQVKMDTFDGLLCCCSVKRSMCSLVRHPKLLKYSDPVKTLCYEEGLGPLRRNMSVSELHSTLQHDCRATYQIDGDTISVSYKHKGETSECSGRYHVNECRLGGDVCPETTEPWPEKEILCCCNDFMLCNADFTSYKFLTMWDKKKVVERARSCYFPMRSRFLMKHPEKGGVVRCPIHYDFLKDRVVHLLEENNMQRVSKVSPFEDKHLCTYYVIAVLPHVPEKCHGDGHYTATETGVRMVYLCQCDAVADPQCDRPGHFDIRGRYLQAKDHELDEDMAPFCLDLSTVLRDMNFLEPDRVLQEMNSGSIVYIHDNFQCLMRVTIDGADVALRHLNLTIEGHEVEPGHHSSLCNHTLAFGAFETWRTLEFSCVLSDDTLECCYVAPFSRTTLISYLKEMDRKLFVSANQVRLLLPQLERATRCSSLDNEPQWCRTSSGCIGVGPNADRFRSCADKMAEGRLSVFEDDDDEDDDEIMRVVARACTDYVRKAKTKEKQCFATEFTFKGEEGNLRPYVICCCAETPDGKCAFNNDYDLQTIAKFL